MWRAPEGPDGLAAVPVGGGRAWPGFETTRRAAHQPQRPHWCGGRRRVRRAWLRCLWAAAGPGRASSRRAERSSRRGRRAGGPPPTGAPSSPAQQGSTCGARNTRGATSKQATTSAKQQHVVSYNPVFTQLICWLVWQVRCARIACIPWEYGVIIGLAGCLCDVSLKYEGDCRPIPIAVVII